ncbi:MAG: hypothetical protein WBG04_02545 [Haloferula sp.]
MDGGDSTEFAVGEIKAEAEVIAEAFCGGVEEVGEELAAFAEDPPQDLGDGEDELTVRDFMADGGGDPVAGAAHAALVAGGAEAALAGVGEEAFVAAVGTLYTGEAGGKVAATKKTFDGGDGLASERAEAFAMAGFVLGEEVIPAVVDELPEGRGARTPGLVDGGHKECSKEHLLCEASSGGIDRMGWISGRVEGQAESLSDSGVARCSSSRSARS